MEVGWLDRLFVGRLRELGVMTVRDFLLWDSERGHSSLVGLNVGPAVIRRWQTELALQCQVGLAPADAGLLAACGISGPQTLADCDVDTLYRRIEDLLAVPEARQRYGSIVRFERPRLVRWIQAARSYCGRQPAPAEVRLQLHPQPTESRTEAQPRLVPRARRVEPLAETLRFYLEPTDPILDAPSIGPKTAERFHAIGVTTVAELLALDPVDAATRINYRRITAELIRAWQQQTLLVCRVPNLRGLDAQLLIACQVFGPEQLAKLEPQALLAQLEPLLASPEGKRILRGAQPPELTQIAAWIRWAQHARPMAAA
jgi:hypothetical protein